MRTIKHKSKTDNLVNKSYQAFKLNSFATSTSLISQPFNFWPSYATNPAV